MLAIYASMLIFYFFILWFIFYLIFYWDVWFLFFSIVILVELELQGTYCNIHLWENAACICLLLDAIISSNDEHKDTDNQFISIQHGPV
jgi:hypothetical protein